MLWFCYVVFPIKHLAAFYNYLVLYTYRTPLHLLHRTDKWWYNKYKLDVVEDALSVQLCVLTWSWHEHTQMAYIQLYMNLAWHQVNCPGCFDFNIEYWIDLINHLHAEVWMPTPEEMEVFAAAIRVKYPVLDDIWSAMDGLKLYLQKVGITKLRDI